MKPTLTLNRKLSLGMHPYKDETNIDIEPVSSVWGMHPNKEEDETYIDLEP